MESNLARMIATFFIWLGFTSMVIWGKPGSLSGGDVVTMTAILGVIAAISTGVIWRSARGWNDHSERRATEVSQKLKHSERSRAARLAAALDDEDAAALLDELKSRLEGSADGEVVPLESLMQDREQRTARR